MVDIETRRDNSEMRIRNATVADLSTIARIHKLAYSRDHFTALLPDEVLGRYYGYFLDGGAEISLVWGDPNVGKSGCRVVEEALGFAVYGVGIPERLAQFKKECFTDILIASLRHPWSAARKTLALASSKLESWPPRFPTDFLLLSIAVALPRRGIGGLLLSALLDEAQKGGRKCVGLYVNAENMNAINAYFSVGFRIVDYRGGQFYMEKDFCKRVDAFPH